MLQATAGGARRAHGCWGMRAQHCPCPQPFAAEDPCSALHGAPHSLLLCWRVEVLRDGAQRGRCNVHQVRQHLQHEAAGRGGKGMCMVWAQIRGANGSSRAVARSSGTQPMLHHPENPATQHCHVTRLRVLAAAAAAGAMPSIHPCSRAAFAPARRWASKPARGHCRLGLQGERAWAEARHG